MAGVEPIYYWDTCLFLAWIKDEQRPTGEMDGVREVVERFKRREVKIVTSVVTTVEVLSGKIPIGMESLISGLMKRINRLGVDMKIAQVAHDLRNYYSINRDKYDGKILSTPDAMHLATAILHRATEFHTFDRDGDGKNLGLLPLSGDVGGNRLIICKPQARNPQLDLRKPRSAMAGTTPSSPNVS